MPKLIKKQRVERVMNDVTYIRTYVTENSNITKTPEKITHKKRPVQDKIRNEIMSEFSRFGRLRVW